MHSIFLPLHYRRRCCHRCYYYYYDFYFELLFLPCDNSRAILFSGTIAFLRSISLEAVGLGVHLAAGAHDILLQAEYILTSIPHVSWPVQENTVTNVRRNQPKGAQQGIEQVNISIYLISCA